MWLWAAAFVVAVGSPSSQLPSHDELEGLGELARSDNIDELKANEATLSSLLGLSRQRLATLERKVTILREEKTNAEVMLETHEYLGFVSPAETPGRPRAELARAFCAALCSGSFHRGMHCPLPFTA